MAALETPACAIGWQAKDFTLEDAYGNPFRQSDLKGPSGTLVMFMVGLDRLLPRRPERLAKLILALIVARVIEPAAKLAAARQLSEATAWHSLAAGMGVREVDEDDLYRPLDVL